MSHENIKIDFSIYCKRLYDKGLVHATAGNVSVRCGDGFIITPSGCCLGEIEPNDGVKIKIDAKKGLESEKDLDFESPKPSTEWLIHQRIYEARDSIQAIVHTHPPKATGFAIAGVALDKSLLAEILLFLGEVPLIPYILPGSQQLADAVYETIKTHHAVLLANHGVITTGETIREAYHRMELVESLAEMTLVARQLNNMNELSETQVQEIYQAKAYTPLKQ